MKELAGKHIVLGLSGGVACYKSAELCRALIKEGATVQVVMTEAAAQFITPVTMQALSNRPVYGSQWDAREANNMPHINLSREADAILIAPCSADFIARLAQGRADELLSLLCLARPQERVPLLLAPAMNREMWAHPATQRNLAQVAQDGATVLAVGNGDQACGETGDGRMLEPAELLEEVIAFFRESLDRSGIPEKRILGMGIGITGRVNSHTGHSFNYFDFPEKPLAAYIGKHFSFPVYLDNDTRVSGLAEQVFGQARERKNAFVVNLSRGLGLVIISNGEIVEGEESFAGEFGHIQFGDSDRLCLCGKRGCLGTEVSGYALEQNFREKRAAGEVSLLSAPAENGSGGSVQYGDILEAALGGDALSISLVHQIGFRLGKALGSMINLLNPGVIIIGGTFSTAGEILTDAIKAGMRHTALMLPLRSCELIFSSLGSDGAVKGAGAIVLRKLKLI